MRKKLIERFIGITLGFIISPSTPSFALNGGPNQPMDGLQVVQSCGVMSPYGTIGGGTATIGLGGVLTTDINGNLCTNATSGGGSTGAVYPSGGNSGSSNGVGAGDANAFAVTPSGAPIAGWTPPAFCTQPTGYGFQYYLQCTISSINLPAKVEGNAGAIVDALPGSDATNALAVQGITGGEPLSVTSSSQTVTTANVTGISSATTSELIAATSGQGIYILAAHIAVDAADNVTLKYGQKVTNPCDTSAVTIDGPEYWATGAGLTVGSGIATVISIPATATNGGNELCATTTTTAHLFGFFTYVKK